MTFQHKYVETGSLSVQNSLVHKQFNATGMYDPDPAIGGHQPLFFDQLSLIYDHYTVIGAQIKWTLTHEGGADFLPVRVCAWLNDDTTTSYTDMNNIIESTGSKSKSMVVGASSPPITIIQKYSAKAVFGGNVMSNINLQGSPLGNPPEGHYFQISMIHFDTASAAPSDVWYTAEVEYIAVWKERKEVASS